ncbi:MAG: protein kinase [Anaerolineae bacterium]|nr:protein kinase [Anaerolineae bacterium]
MTIETASQPRLIANRYRVEDRLGAGSMGIVYRAYDRLDDTQVALKEVQVDIELLQFSSQFDLPSKEMKRVALAKEFQTLSSLRHPHIVSVLDYGFDSQQSPFFTMEYLQNAQGLVDASQDKSVTDKVQYLIQILQALAYLHRRGLIHRDLKPDNVLVLGNTVRLVDFGLSVALEKASGVEGTLAYMAPEVLQTGQAVRESELYAVGVMAYELFAGKLPYDPLDLTSIIQTVPDFDVLDIPESLTIVIARLLSKDPADRYSSAFEVIEALQKAMQLPPSTEDDLIRESYLQAANFVGREAEFRQLEAALQEALAGNGSAWLIGGESGIGKSRLLDEVGTYAMVNGARVLKGQAVEGGGVPYQLWHEVIRRMALFTEFDDAEISILKEIVPDLDKLVQRDTPGVPKLSAKDRQDQLVLTILNMFRRSTQPLVLLLEDLQWTKESLVPLKNLNRLVEKLPLLIIATYRDDERPNLPQDLPEMHPISLQRLDTSGIAALSASMLGDVGQEPHFLEFVQKETEGNVFFLVEVVRALAEEAGRLTDVGRVTLPATVIAGGIQQIVNRRLKRVPAWGQQLLKLAAIQGRQIDVQVLEQTGDVPEQGLDHWLMTCSEAAVLEVHDGRWRFRHDKLREALLLNLADQPALFKQVAEAMEATYADNLDPHASALAQHWRAAGDIEKERHYNWIAAIQAFETCSYRESLHLYQRVAALDASRDTSPKDTALLHLNMGMTLQRLTEYNTAREHQLKALALFTELDDKANLNETIAQLSDIEVRQSNFAKGREYLEQSMALAEQRGDRKRLGYDLMTLGNLQHLEEEYELALKTRERCYQIMSEVGEPLDVAKALNNLAISYDFSGDMPHALEVHQQALEIRRQLHDRSGIATSLINMAAISVDLEDFDRAQKLLPECLTLFQEIGARHGTALVYETQGKIALKHEDHALARAKYKDGLAIRLEIGDQHGAASDLVSLTDIDQETGELHDALRNLSHALEIRVGLEIESLLAKTLDRIAVVYGELKHFDHALTLLAFLKQMDDLPESIKDLDQRVADMLSHLDADAIAKTEQAGQSASMDTIVKTTQDTIRSIVGT